MKKVILVAIVFFLLGVTVMIPRCHNDAAQNAIEKFEDLSK